MPEITDSERRAARIEEILNLARRIPTNPNPQAHDWAGFFAALAAFAQAILPLIAPLLQPTPPPKSKKS
jgi:hypothetical protein